MNVKEQLRRTVKEQCGKDISAASDRELYNSLLVMTKVLLENKPKIEGKKRVYYISAEFLIGKLLSNNLINLGIYEDIYEELKEHGKELSVIEELEPEPSLGNGGLGRLAACFLDSIASLGLPGDGIGLNYHFGLFRQSFRDKLQYTEKDEWMEDHSWLNKTGVTFPVYFGDKKVISCLYDIDVVGYDNGKNKLHLFDIETADESLVTEGIAFDKEKVEKNLTLFLYPDDSDKEGNLLRIYQQYFMVSSGAQFILREVKEDRKSVV